MALSRCSVLSLQKLHKTTNTVTAMRKREKEKVSE